MKGQLEGRKLNDTIQNFSLFITYCAEIARSQLPALTDSKGHHLCCTLTVATGLT